jgi:hypothetical protein
MDDAQVEAHALSLSSGPQVNGAVFHSDGDIRTKAQLRSWLANYRYLTSLPSCPRPMRIPIAPALYARRFDKSSMLPEDYCWPQPSIWPPWAYCYHQTAAGLPRLPYVAPSPPMPASDALLLRSPPSPSGAELSTPEMASSEDPRPVTTEDLALQAPPCADLLGPLPLWLRKEECASREREHISASTLPKADELCWEYREFIVRRAACTVHSGGAPAGNHATSPTDAHSVRRTY